MTPTDMSRLKLGESFQAEEFDVLPNRVAQCFIHAYPDCVELHERSSANAAHYHDIHFPTFQRSNGIAHAMGVMLVSILDYRYRFCIGIDKHESRC